MPRIYATFFFVFVFIFILLADFSARGQEAPPPAELQAPATSSTAPAPTPTPSEVSKPEVERLTLWVMIRVGGPVLWIIVVLSIGALILATYLFTTVTTKREIPPTLVRRAHTQISSGDLKSAFDMCDGRPELLANVLRAGLRMAGHDRYVVQEAMESEGERAATALWQRISYLNNIGVIAPLLGLLGTVTGMIGAFSSIALDDSKVKSLNMAYSVSQAMITTAAGLIVAIPAMLAYFYLRGQVVKIVSEVESQATEFLELIVKHGKS